MLVFNPNGPRCIIQQWPAIMARDESRAYKMACDALSTMARDALSTMARDNGPR